MKKCWAEKLGNCAGDISKEHLVTSNLFTGETVLVKGLSWCKNEEIIIGLPNFTSNVLCKKHNNGLSQVDVEGARSFKTLREAKEQFFIRQNLKQRRWTISRFSIDGSMLERWFLKTGINLVYYNQKQLKDENQSPDIELLEIIYGIRNVEERFGLYMVFSDQQEISQSETIEFSSVLNNKNEICGYRFSLQGFRFWVSLYLKKFNEITNHTTSDESVSWSNSKLVYHPSKLKIKQGKHVSQIIYFKW